MIDNIIKLIGRIMIIIGILILIGGGFYINFVTSIPSQKVLMMGWFIAAVLVLTGMSFKDYGTEYFIALKEHPLQAAVTTALICIFINKILSLE